MSRSPRGAHCAVSCNASAIAWEVFATCSAAASIAAPSASFAQPATYPAEMGAESNRCTRTNLSSQVSSRATVGSGGQVVSEGVADDLGGADAGCGCVGVESRVGA